MYFDKAKRIWSKNILCQFALIDLINHNKLRTADKLGVVFELHVRIKLYPPVATIKIAVWKKVAAKLERTKHKTFVSCS